LPAFCFWQTTLGRSVASFLSDGPSTFSISAHADQTVRVSSVSTSWQGSIVYIGVHVEVWGGVNGDTATTNKMLAHEKRPLCCQNGQTTTPRGWLG